MMRDEAGQVVDGWIVVMPKRSYLFHAGNTALEAIHAAGTRYRSDGFNHGSSVVSKLFRHSYCGNRHRSRRAH